MNEHLLAGSFRLVLVLDESPLELVQLAGYLEVIAPDLEIDLVTVAAYEAGGVELMAPQRMDPERMDRTPVRSPASASPGKGFLAEGSDDFVQAIEDAAEEHRALLQQLADWADELATDGLIELSTYHGARAGQIVLLPRFRDSGTGLATIYNDNGVPSIAFWRSVFEGRAPGSLERVEQLIAPMRIGQGGRTSTITDALLEALRGAYEEGALRRANVRTIDKVAVRALVGAIPQGRWLSYADVAEAVSGSRTGGMAVGGILASDSQVSSDSVHRVLTSQGKVSPGFRGTIGGPAEAKAQLESEGISFDHQSRADPSQRVHPSDLVWNRS